MKFLKTYSTAVSIFQDYATNLKHRMTFRWSHYLDFISVAFYIIDGDRRQPQPLTLPVKQHGNIYLVWTHLSVPCIWKTSLPEEWSAAWSSVGGETIFLKNLKGEPKIFMRAKKGKGYRLVQLWWCNAMKNRAEQQQLCNSPRKIKIIKSLWWFLSIFKAQCYILLKMCLNSENVS